MGGAIAARLAADAAWDVAVYDPSPAACERFAGSRARLLASRPRSPRGATTSSAACRCRRTSIASTRPAGSSMRWRPQRRGRAEHDRPVYRPPRRRRGRARGAAFVASPLGMGPRQAADGSCRSTSAERPPTLRAPPRCWRRSRRTATRSAASSKPTRRSSRSTTSAWRTSPCCSKVSGSERRPGSIRSCWCKLMQDGGARSFQSDVRLPWISREISPALRDRPGAEGHAARDRSRRPLPAPGATGAAALQHFSRRSGRASAGRYRRALEGRRSAGTRAPVTGLRERLDAGVAAGVGLTFATPQLVELCGRVGFHWALLDCEHGASRRRRSSTRASPPTRRG